LTVLERESLAAARHWNDMIGDGRRRHSFAEMRDLTERIAREDKFRPLFVSRIIAATARRFPLRVETHAPNCLRIERWSVNCAKSARAWLLAVRFLANV
jgi:hypothetical protein